MSTNTLNHKDLLSGEFWKLIPGYKDIDTATFYDSTWQLKKSVTQINQLQEALGNLLTEDFKKDIEKGLSQVPMSIRIPPYIISLINWSDPINDPLRKQFLPISSKLLKDHPRLSLDSLHEEEDAVAPGLTHRYPDKVLFLALKLCPLYCRYCTRSYAVGLDTEQVKKVNLLPTAKRWEETFQYLRNHPEVEDVVISGGDSYMLKADQIELIGKTLIEIPHIRRMRFATRGPAIMPMKILSDHEWTSKLIEVVKLGRKHGKDVVVHTHFSHPNEITEITQKAIQKLFEEGVYIRNQSVLLRGVNDTVETMQLLVKKLSYVNVHPYYVFQHDMVKGVEDLRTTLKTSLELEKSVRGLTAGFNTPMFVVDLPGGGGKRDVHSYEYYNPTTGISVYKSPNVDKEEYFFYFDPLDLLPPIGQKMWENPNEHPVLIQQALDEAKKGA